MMIVIIKYVITELLVSVLSATKSHVISVISISYSLPLKISCIMTSFPLYIPGVMLPVMPSVSLHAYTSMCDTEKVRTYSQTVRSHRTAVFNLHGHFQDTDN